MPDQPLIAIIDWKSSPLSEPEALVERRVIGDAARVESYLADMDGILPDPVYQADAILLWHNIPIGAPTLEKLSRCQAIIRNGVGFDSVDIEAAQRLGIPVCNVPDYGTEEVADHAIALAMSLCRQLFPLDQEAKKLGWTIRVKPLLRRLSTLTFGIIGLGRIGTAAALRAKALGFRVVFYDPYLPNGVHKAIGVERAGSLNELLAQTEVLSIHCPLNQETQYMIGRRELDLLKENAFVVNTARGGIVDKLAILDALREGRLAGAGLDVIDDEPLKSEEDAATPNLIATCHAAFCSLESVEEMRSTSARIGLAAVLGRPLENVVNGPVAPRSTG
ncbi:MAG: C-terminal binding protein [Verrucomicrobia bacterium]|nr:MAG: C-terminal binding protein [Verrucomicrobiota bacterium]